MPRSRQSKPRPSLGTDAAVITMTCGMSRGKEPAFREFQAVYFDRLLRYLLVVTRGDAEMARDALQETFLRVARYVRRFEREEVFWSWLTVLARSAARDGGRRQRSYWRMLADYTRAWLPVASNGSTSREDHHPWISSLDRSLEELSPVERTLIEGKYMDGTSVNQLARQTGLTEKAVESRLLRARKQLKNSLLKRLNDEN